MSLPVRRFYPVAEVATSWEADTDVLIEYAVDGDLEIGARLFGKRVRRLEGEVVGQEPNRTVDEEVLSGVFPLLPADLWKIRCQGIARVCCFGSRHGSAQWYQIASVEPEIELTVAGLLISAEERHRFEHEHGLTSGDADRDVFVHSPDYRSITMNGRQFMLSGTKAAVIRILHEAWCSRSPWMEKKQLLKVAGSGSSRVPDVFPDFEQRQFLFACDGHGNWRLRLPDQPTRKVAFRRALQKPHLTLVR